MKPRPGQRVQLHRALSKLGLGSRTEARRWIKAGEVTVDGRVVTDPLTWVDLRQDIRRHGQPLAPIPSLTLALHKPAGIVTTRRDERGRRTVYDLLPGDLPWVLPVGRLDADSEGLLLFTTDHALSVRLTDPQHAISKTYHVTVTGRPGAVILDRLRAGIDLPDGRTRPAQIRVLEELTDRTILEIVLTEGRNRQIRRMAEAVGHPVERLLRVVIGGYQLGDLAPGASRILEPDDLDRLLQQEKR
jgi:23S rRNA pseudouridine2605 synthase